LDEWVNVVEAWATCVLRLDYFSAVYKFISLPVSDVGGAVQDTKQIVFKCVKNI
jgi:hypothetical protein